MHDALHVIMPSAFFVTMVLAAVLVGVQVWEERNGRESLRLQRGLVYVASVFGTVGLGCLVLVVLGAGRP